VVGEVVFELDALRVDVREVNEEPRAHVALQPHHVDVTSRPVSLCTRHSHSLSHCVHITVIHCLIVYTSQSLHCLIVYTPQSLHCLIVYTSQSLTVSLCTHHSHSLSHCVHNAVTHCLIVYMSQSFTVSLCTRHSHSLSHCVHATVTHCLIVYTSQSFTVSLCTHHSHSLSHCVHITVIHCLIVYTSQSLTVSLCTRHSHTLSYPTHHSHFILHHTPHTRQTTLDSCSRPGGMFFRRPLASGRASGV